MGGDSLPLRLTDVQARDYVDSLKKSKLAPNTIRDKLSALGGLWTYMAERLIVPKGTTTPGKVSPSREALQKHVEHLPKARFLRC